MVKVRVNTMKSYLGCMKIIFKNTGEVEILFMN